MQHKSMSELLGDYPPLLSLSQASKITGLSPKTWRNWLTAGQCPVPAIRVGRAIRVKLHDLAEWIDAGGSLLPERQKRKPGRPRKSPKA
ncbi:MAG TPA: hypothetical protein DEQ20_10500 [Desulfobulbaceae bacterium]|nr:hypothetical protein [Desulfobulbaceae bacterium]